MAKKKNETKEEPKKEQSFDYQDYIEKTFNTPKAFIYYIIVNGLTFKNREEVDEAYNIFKQLGGN